VSRLAQQETTKGGIIIPDTAKEKPMEGTVVAVGTGYHSEDGKVRPLAVKENDTIIFNKWSGT
jgi:chaperonin GroES